MERVRAILNAINGWVGLIAKIVGSSALIASTIYGAYVFVFLRQPPEPTPQKPRVERQQVERQADLEQPNLRLLAGIGAAPPRLPSFPIVWPDVHMEDFNYFVEYYSQGDGVKRVRPVSCVGKLDLDICRKSSEYRRANPIHYEDWLSLPPKP
jgi:hypothetical protein